MPQSSNSLAEWGVNGLPQVVPGSQWAAVSVFCGDVNAYTSIYAFHDDPLFAFRTPVNSPWLTSAECAAVNLPHRKIYWKKETRTFSLDAAAALARNNAFTVLRREPVMKQAWQNPCEIIDTDIGGHLPIGVHVSEDAFFIVTELAERQALKAKKDFASADLIRRVITGGGVEVIDKPTGTYWFYA